MWERSLVYDFLRPKFGKRSFHPFFVFPKLGNVVFMVFAASQNWETPFSSFSEYPKVGKCCFRGFFVFPLGGTPFSRFFRFPPGGKRRFCSFEAFISCWNAEIVFFCSSSPAETLFFPFWSFQQLLERAVSLWPDENHLRAPAPYFRHDEYAIMKNVTPSWR